MYNREETKWGSADGSERLVKDLSDRHVVNILNWITKHEGQYPSGLYEFFEEEAALRKLWAFAENKPMPTKFPNGIYGFTNITMWNKFIYKAKYLKHMWKIYRKKLEKT